MSATLHLQPVAPLAARVLLPGDPGRARRFARELLAHPHLFNDHRGLLGYTGLAPDGAPLSIQSTGMGGPSTAIVVRELVDLGALRLLRVGTCGALHDSLALGDLLIATEAMAQDGTSRALGAGERVAASPELLEALRGAGAESAEGVRVAEGPVVTTDLFYDSRQLEDRWLLAGALAVEMEAATLFALAAQLGVEAAALLAVTDVLAPVRVRIWPEGLTRAESHLGALAVRALR